MSLSNRISIEITTEQSAAIAEAFQQLKTVLAPMLVINLTAEERQSTLKMGDKTLAFVNKTLDYASQNPTLVPNYVDLAEARKDNKLAADIYGIFQQLSILLRAVEDTGMVVGSEAYEAALVIYHSIKGASRSDIPGTQVMYDDLKQRFPGRGKSIIAPEQ
ncbi:hypothetical protein EV200_1087 [Pedobacter psychrotolerans]|uniref:Uncharacterized protein n=1 Tax=Pedobacter psychrotolerans TaxID=1843235 RepID=A0A4R2H519_9SPHI|nr:hypothetical protein [Pedobacter psychrotolerans]TCO20567.1 hypothetical protein EV200_1087 [Pedobacter psychrotolerans]GGE66471.1 hypothetical protein GCM10011413_36250 [Pedobacter psychrotolerans]